MLKFLINSFGRLKPFKRNPELQVQEYLQTKLMQCSQLANYISLDFYNNLGINHTNREKGAVSVEKTFELLNSALDEYSLEYINTTRGEYFRQCEQFYAQDFAYNQLVNPEDCPKEPDQVTFHETDQIEYEYRELPDMQSPQYKNPFPGIEPETIAIMRHLDHSISQRANHNAKVICNRQFYLVPELLKEVIIPKTPKPKGFNILHFCTLIGYWKLVIFSGLALVGEFTLYHFLLETNMNMDSNEAWIVSSTCFFIFSVCGFCFFKHVERFMRKQRKVPILFWVLGFSTGLFVLGMVMLNVTRTTIEELQVEQLEAQREINQALRSLYLNPDDVSAQKKKAENLLLFKEIKQRINERRALKDLLAIITMGTMGLAIFLSIGLGKSMMMLVHKSAHHRRLRDKSHKYILRTRQQYKAFVSRHHRARMQVESIVFYVSCKHIIEGFLAMNPKTSEFRNALQPNTQSTTKSPRYEYS